MLAAGPSASWTASLGSPGNTPCTRTGTVDDAVPWIGTGALRVLDDEKQISFVVTVCLVCYGAGGYFGAAHANERAAAGDCKPVIARLHQCFWFNPKKNAPAICRK